MSAVVDVTSINMCDVSGDRDEDQDLANDFMRLNFDPPDNLAVTGENAQRFCQQVPGDMRIVLISVSRSCCCDR